MIAYSYVFILLTLASGYTSLKLSHITKYRIIKYSGQELFFSSAVVGMFVFLIGYLICRITEISCYPFFVWYSDIFTDKSIMYIVSGWAISIPIIFLAINKLLSNDKSISRFIEEQNDGIERLLKISELQTKPLLVTLTSGKVYIGFVSQSFFSPVENKSFTIVPLFSGYRDSETQELHLTNKYVDLIVEHITKNNHNDEEYEINDFIVALPISTIISASIFSMEVYSELHAEDIDDSDEIMSFSD